MLGDDYEKASNKNKNLEEKILNHIRLHKQFLSLSNTKTRLR